MMLTMRRFQSLILVLLLLTNMSRCMVYASSTSHTHRDEMNEQQDDTWAVIVNASKFWLNYRHTANAMAMYHSLKRMGLPDSRIVLMHADCATCDPRMMHPGKTYYRPQHTLLAPEDWESDDVEIDYRDLDVTAESVMRVLTGNTKYGASHGQVLGSTSSSNVLLFLTGHGGDSFLKFHDQSELMASDLGATIEYMKMVGRFKQLFVILDTCQASTMYEDVNTKGWAGAASSKRDQSSYALNSDSQVGTFLIDEFSHHMYEYLKIVQGGMPHGEPTFDDMMKYIMSKKMSSEVQFDSSRLGSRGNQSVLVKDFFGPRVTKAYPAMTHAPPVGVVNSQLVS